ncbi:MAG: SDR family oxidoreductase [Microbacteriaceae bacterium]
MKSGRVVVVTGAAGGVGSVLVSRFLENGDTVLATDSSEAALARLVEANPRGSLVTRAADVSRDDDVDALANAAQRQWGRVDVLVNCAGFFPIVPFEQMTSADWRTVLEINLTGTFLVTHALMPLMRGRGWGRIINFGSASVFDGTPGQSHYVAAKAGVIGFSRSLAREVGGEGITVNVVTPGLTVTQAVRDHFPPGVLEAQRARRAIQRDEVPADLVGPVFFLASPDSDFISGQTLNVDGGKFML